MMGANARLTVATAFVILYTTLLIALFYDEVVPIEA